MLPLQGKPVLQQIVERLSRSVALDGIVVATSLDATDDCVFEFCEAHDINCFRGDLHNVLKRFVDASVANGVEAIVRVTADCPFLDPALLDEMIQYFRISNFDILTNSLPPSFPDGLDLELFTAESLERVAAIAIGEEKEHVTLGMYHHPEIFRIGSYISPQNLSEMRWTLDEPRDYEFIRQIYDILAPSKPDFLMRDILTLLEKKPELLRYNSGIMRNEGLDYKNPVNS